MRKALPLLLAFLLPLLALSQSQRGVTDGDTVRVLTGDKRQLRVRLNGIDAPEKTQPFGERSRQWLAACVFGKDLLLVASGTDRYGRTLGVLKLGAEDVNLASVKNGWAWWYRAYARGRLDLSAAERNAREARRGLWAGPTPQAPWDYRRASRTRLGTSSPAPPRAAGPGRRPSPRRAATKAEAKGDVVYVIETGRRYHKAGCGSLWHSCIKTTRKAARAMGLTPCQRCGG